MLVHRLRRWPNIKPTMAQCLVFAGLAIFIGEFVIWITLTFFINFHEAYPSQLSTYTSQSDVCKCQILSYDDGPRAERIKIL